MQSKTSTPVAEPLLRISKILNAPAEQVWKAWTLPEHITQWWGPEGFTSTIHKMDMTEGGEWLLTLHGPDGKNYPNKSVFGEIIPLKKIVYHHFYPRFIGTVLFKEAGEKTEIEWTMTFESEELYKAVVTAHKADTGLKQNVEKLELYLPKMNQN